MATEVVREHSRWRDRTDALLGQRGWFRSFRLVCDRESGSVGRSRGRRRGGAPVDSAPARTTWSRSGTRGRQRPGIERGSAAGRARRSGAAGEPGRGPTARGGAVARRELGRCRIELESQLWRGAHFRKRPNVGHVVGEHLVFGHLVFELIVFELIVFELERRRQLGTPSRRPSAGECVDVELYIVLLELVLAEPVGLGAGRQPASTAPPGAFERQRVGVVVCASPEATAATPWYPSRPRIRRDLGRRGADRRAAVELRPGDSARCERTVAWCALSGLRRRGVGRSLRSRSVAIVGSRGAAPRLVLPSRGRRDGSSPRWRTHYLGGKLHRKCCQCARHTRYDAPFLPSGAGC